MASFIKVDNHHGKVKFTSTTSCCNAQVKTSKDGSHFVCPGCEEEVVPVQTGVSIEHAMMEHARKNNKIAKHTTTSPMRHNSIQMLQDFGEATFVKAIDQWELWNIKDKTEEDLGHIDKLVMGIINVYIMKRCLTDDVEDIMVHDIAAALYQDEDYLVRLCRKKIPTLAKKIGFSTTELARDMFSICEHELLKEVLRDGFCNAEVD